MTLTLDPTLEQRIQPLLDSGRFRDAADCLSYALDLIEEQATLTEEDKIALNAHLDESYAQILRGEGIDGPTVKREMEEMLCDRRHANAA